MTISLGMGQRCPKRSITLWDDKCKSYRERPFFPSCCLKERDWIVSPSSCRAMSQARALGQWLGSSGERLLASPGVLQGPSVRPSAVVKAAQPGTHVLCRFVATLNAALAPLRVRHCPEVRVVMLLTAVDMLASHQTRRPSYRGPAKATRSGDRRDPTASVPGCSERFELSRATLPVQLHVVRPAEVSDGRYSGALGADAPLVFRACFANSMEVINHSELPPQRITRRPTPRRRR